MSDADIAEDIEAVHYVSPPEYVKRANAREHRERHAVDLHQFVDFLVHHRCKGAAVMRNLPDAVDTIIADYLNDVEPEL
jgi:hypothetical protein